MLPDWRARSLDMSALPSLVALDVLADRLENLEAGKAVFVHLLLPNDPFILDENCQLKSDTSLWLAPQSVLWWYRIKADPQRRLARYDEYYKQVTCLHRRLSSIFERLEERGKLDDATVMVHGDHGSRITLVELFAGNERLLTPGDIIDSVSTIFAVRGPGVTPGPVEGQFSIQGLFAELALGRDDIADHSDIFLRAPRLGIGPGQTRLPMVPYRESQ
jgi:arylsulfatase A-like enzyme